MLFYYVNAQIHSSLCEMLSRYHNYEIRIQHIIYIIIRLEVITVIILFRIIFICSNFLLVNHVLIIVQSILVTNLFW